ncbi:cysteine desulfurase family protein [Thermodesulfatator indicus DSM 15286]|uniref:cysteine desulfurase n=1 Tax=Thermodesulfatator indicus (strain DSM 15286 / JCM 11887 / CIR29812) TaxID=667014 RepID=F8ADZ1_THEID|nr:aminotransferase class V-fold PLP-dependent enzyme [Thermodesulfatator indicus]AEH44956.1 cysteine desulfurase family protein [Thermodesulfatator indicus DSM 15286]
MIYLDQAATSFPKPSEVIEAVGQALRNTPGSPGRSAHQGALAASHIIFEAREKIASFIGAEDSTQVIFTSGATESLNLVIMGLLNPGDRVIATHVEHNSVARPLEYLRKTREVKVVYAPCNEEGLVELETLERLIKEHKPRLLCVNLVSNVTGAIQPLAEILKIKGKSLVLVDAAQAVGHIPVDVTRWDIDFLAFSGHKGVFGPPGVGVLYIKPGRESELSPIKLGGTGSRSESLEAPEFLPDRFEPGTPNLCGIAGLSAGIDFIEETSLMKIHRHTTALADLFLEKIKDHPKIKIYGPKERIKAIPIVSINIEGLSPSEVALRLDKEFQVAVRPGLHCAPLAHKAIGTFPQGTVRFSFGYFNRVSEVEKAAEALLKIAA